MSNEEIQDNKAVEGTPANNDTTATGPDAVTPPGVEGAQELAPDQSETNSEAVTETPVNENLSGEGEGGVVDKAENPEA